MIRKLQKVAKFILHHNTLTAITFLLFGIGCYFVIISNDSNKLGTISNMATALAIIVAMIQLLASNRQHRETARRAAAEKAIEIARYFQSTVIHDMSFHTMILTKIGQSKYEQAKQLECSSLRFTLEELVELFGEEAPKDVVIMAQKLTPQIWKDAERAAAHVIDRTLTDSDDNQQIGMHSSFYMKRCDLLNTLEWIAMTLNTGVADEKVIYQSIHQTFLRYIRLEYPFIVQYNSDDCANGQYFTNIMQLYNAWQKRKMKHQRIDKRNIIRMEWDAKRTNARSQKRHNRNVNHVPRL